mgnify:CR=1 FL=1
MKSLKIANDKTKETMVIGWSENINRIHKTMEFGRSISDVVSRAIYTEVYQVPKEWYNDIENYIAIFSKPLPVNLSKVAVVSFSGLDLLRIYS